MPLDGLAVSVITHELNSTLYNARVMKVYQPDRFTVVLHLRLPGENRKLLLAADPGQPRIHTTEADLANPKTPPAFCMLLRKHLEPSRILSITQPGYERIIRLRFEAYNDQYQKVQKTLVLELMGRHSNLILVDQNNAILDALRRFPAESKSVRVTMPGEPYEEPPDQGKQNPDALDKDQFVTDLRLLSPTVPLFKGLVNLYQGLGPQAAKQILNSAGISPRTTRETLDLDQLGTIWEAFAEFFAAVRGGGQAVLVEGQSPDFFAYKVDAPSQSSYPNLDTLLDAFYSQRITQRNTQQVGSRLTKCLQTHLKRVKRKQAIQQQALADADNAETYRKQGELLTANLHRVPRKASELLVVDYYQEEQPEISIPLDPARSPSANAQWYFRKYAKAKKSQKFTRAQLRNTRAERRYIEELLVQVAQADTEETLAEIRDEMQREGYFRATSRPKNVETRKCDEYVANDGTPILVGRNNRQNDEVTFRIARPTDIWCHAQKIPGSHVIIRSDHGPSDEALVEAATLAAYFSKARTSPKVPVDYTERRHVKKPPGAKPGFVIYDNFQTITVDPTEHKPRLSRDKTR